MKVLIWFLCLLANSLITVSLNYNGIALGAIPVGILYFLTITAAMSLCRRWDKHKKRKLEQIDRQSINNQNVKRTMEIKEPQLKNFTVCIYDEVSHNVRKEERTVDVNKFPTEKYAVDGVYYAVEKMKNDKKVRVYYTKSNWQIYIDNQSVDSDKIKFCRKCGFELIDESDFCSQCGTKIIK